MQAKGMLGQEYYTTHYNFLVNQLFGCDESPCFETKYDYRKYPKAKEQPLTIAEILNNKHAVVRFTATWCPPCKALAPVFDEVAAAHPDVKVYVIDVDQHQDIARDLNVRGIPTCMAIRDNKVDSTIVGNQPKPELEKLFK
jgi:thioredoxin 1